VISETLSRKLNIMKALLTEFIEAIESVISQYFSCEPNYISKDIREILDHVDDRKKYFIASNNLRNGSQSETFILHTGKSFTITR